MTTFMFTNKRPCGFSFNESKKVKKRSILATLIKLSLTTLFYSIYMVIFSILWINVLEIKLLNFKSPKNLWTALHQSEGESTKIKKWKGRERKETGDFLCETVLANRGQVGRSRWGQERGKSSGQTRNTTRLRLACSSGRANVSLLLSTIYYLQTNC